MPEPTPEPTPKPMPEPTAELGAAESKQHPRSSSPHSPGTPQAHANPALLCRAGQKAPASAGTEPTTGVRRGRAFRGKTKSCRASCQCTEFPAPTHPTTDNLLVFLGLRPSCCQPAAPAHGNPGALMQRVPPCSPLPVMGSPCNTGGT